jgi:hypothetical protein
VLYVDFEDSAKTFVRRLRQLGIPAAKIRKCAHYIRPSKPLETSKGPVLAAQRALYAAGRAHEPDLVVIDGVTEVMALHGLNPNESTDVARFLDLMPRRWDRTGSAVILIDHVVKSKDDRGRYAIGSQHKMAGINGTSYKFELDGDLSPGRHGEVAITVMKDREGAVREFAKDGKAVGTMHLRPAPDRGPRDLDITIEAAPDEWTPSESLLEAVLGELRKAPASQSAIASAVGRSGDDVGNTLNWLLLRGRVDGGTRKQWRLLGTEPDPDRFDESNLVGPQPDPTLVPNRTPSSPPTGGNEVRIPRTYRRRSDDLPQDRNSATRRPAR